METFNIVEAIESNPNTKLSSTYNNKLIEKIKNNFTLEEQKLYIVSFYSFLNYDEFNDYVVDLDDVWKWLGFVQKSNAKVVLLKHFIKDIDYKVLIMQPHEQNKKGSGGHNKETILLSLNCFKKFCFKAQTKEAEKIYDYYLQIEKCIFGYF
jgi:hypothetical protein